MRLCEVYRPPAVFVKSFMTEFELYLESVGLSAEPLVICGDLSIFLDGLMCGAKRSLVTS